jgi:hypothetical protein
MSTPADNRTDRPTTLRYLTGDGRPVTATVWVGPVLDHDGGLPVRELNSTDSAVTLMQKFVPRELGQRWPAAYDLLENEVRVGVRLTRCYPHGYPESLVRVIGHALDVAEPYLVSTPPRGRPVASATDMTIDELRLFEVTLLQGVLALADAGLVHGRLSPATVRWDDRAAQVGDFSHAADAGTPWQHDGVPPWAPPEQRAGSGAAHPAGDVWAAGAVIYRVATGQPIPLGGTPDLSRRGASLRQLLGGVFAAAPAGRPDAAELLRRLRSGPAAVPAAVNDTAFRLGQREFDEMLERKRASLAPARPPTAVPPPRRPRRWWPGGGTAATPGSGRP